MLRERSTVLVTGATGFIGAALLPRLRQEPGLRVLAASRRSHAPVSGADVVPAADLAPESDWSTALEGVDTVVHLAARVHVMRETTAEPLAEFRRANTAGTVRLARQAAESGVRRFVYLSSIKVNGEETAAGQPFTENDLPAPLDAYGISKHEAEVALGELAAETGLDVVIIRPPLVYGPGVKANFRRMMSWLHRGVPLPLGAIHNQRTLLGIDNLVDLIATCIRHPSAANQTFLAGDGEDLSTTQLLRRLGSALGRPARLIAVPPGLLRPAFALMGQSEMGQRLCGSLQVDITKAGERLGWKPPLGVDENLRRAAREFLERRSTT